MAGIDFSIGFSSICLQSSSAGQEETTITSGNSNSSCFFDSSAICLMPLVCSVCFCQRLTIILQRSCGSVWNISQYKRNSNAVHTAKVMHSTKLLCPKPYPTFNDTSNEMMQMTIPGKPQRRHFSLMSVLADNTFSIFLILVYCTCFLIFLGQS